MEAVERVCERYGEGRVRGQDKRFPPSLPELLGHVDDEALRMSDRQAEILMFPKIARVMGRSGISQIESSGE